MEDITTKTCRFCNIERPITDFPLDRRSKDHRGVKCNLCIEKAKELKKKKQTELVKVKGYYPELAGYTPGQLIKELEYRGYYGELKAVQIIKLTPKDK